MLHDAPLLRRALTLNALFSGLSGLALALAHRPLSAWIGVGQPLVLLGVGAGLLAFALHLGRVARRPIAPSLALSIVVSDALWVAGTAVLVLGFPGALSPAGRALAVAVAAVVGLLAALQLKGLLDARAPARQMDRDGAPVTR